MAILHSFTQVVTGTTSPSAQVSYAQPINFMSSGGYYKYRCKNFMNSAVNCQEWVYVNGYYCGACTLKGY